MEDAMFAQLSDDVVLNIFSKLEEDPRNWARLACVCSKFSSLVRNVLWKNKCLASIPAVVSDLLDPPSEEAGNGAFWASLHKIAVCCPGLVHSGVLLDNSDFGLDRDLGPEETYNRMVSSLTLRDPLNPYPPPPPPQLLPPTTTATSVDPDCSWSLYDDLYYDTVYNKDEESDGSGGGDECETTDAAASASASGSGSGSAPAMIEKGVVCRKKRRKICRQMRSHLASGVWNLSREQGNKLLHSRFRGDSLYICDWPGCVHIEEKRNYMLFRGVFKDFRASQVWRTIKDSNKRKLDLNCAFCGCEDTWDLHSAFCLRRVFGFHEDGEPVVRAYVCQNGHISGAWTDLPLYT